jgi:hypothetical protein
MCIARRNACKTRWDHDSGNVKDNHQEISDLRYEIDLFVAATALPVRGKYATRGRITRGVGLSCVPYVVAAAGDVVGVSRHHDCAAEASRRGYLQKKRTRALPFRINGLTKNKKGSGLPAIDPLFPITTDHPAEPNPQPRRPEPATSPDLTRIEVSAYINIRVGD